MSDRSAIEWTDATWNPVRGCTKVSPGCKFCYAELFAERFRGVPGHPFEQGFDLRLVPEKLNQPLQWRRPRKIFVNSMSDLFHEDVPADYIARVGDVMRRADWHVFQVLTKRDERLRELLRRELPWMADLEHVAFGVSVEDRQYGLPRIRSLQDTPARIRFLSVEPLLADLGPLDLRGIDWVIVGGESGPHARPMLREWVVKIRRQCRAQRVPFFFKQWGGTRKHETGRTLDGRTYDEFPLAFPSRSRSEQCMTRRSAPNPAYWEQYGPFQHVKHELIRCYLNGARGTDARQDRSSHRGRRRTRCRGHPGLRRTHSAARVRPLGTGVARLQAGTAAVVLPGRNRVRRKSIQSNRRNGTAFQLLGAV